MSLFTLHNICSLCSLSFISCLFCSLMGPTAKIFNKLHSTQVQNLTYPFKSSRILNFESAIQDSNRRRSVVQQPLSNSLNSVPWIKLCILAAFKFNFCKVALVLSVGLLLGYGAPGCHVQMKRELSSAALMFSWWVLGHIKETCHLITSKSA